MVFDLDVYDAATAMRSSHGEEAMPRAVLEAVACFAAGDREGLALWRSVTEMLADRQAHPREA